MLTYNIPGIRHSRECFCTSGLLYFTQNEVALRVISVRGQYFPAIVFAETTSKNIYSKWFSVN